MKSNRWIPGCIKYNMYHMDRCVRPVFAGNGAKSHKHEEGVQKTERLAEAGQRGWLRSREGENCF